MIICSISHNCVGIVSLFSLIVLAMSADILNSFHVRLDFAGLGVATSVFTLVTLPAMCGLISSNQ